MKILVIVVVVVLLSLVFTATSSCILAQTVPPKNSADVISAAVYISDISGKRLQKVQDLEFVKISSTSSTISASSSSSTSSSFALGTNPATPLLVKTFPQSIIGFGGSFMRSGAILFNQLSPAKQDQLLRDLFDPNDGARFTVGKLSVAATDFMPPTWYSYEDVPGNFSIQHDLTEANNGTIPFARRAASAAGINLTIESTMDYPPQWMLDNDGAFLPQNQVNSSFYPKLAQYYVDFFTAFENSGVPISYLDCFNEPFESYVNMTQSQVADFIKNHMGPLIHRMRRDGKRTPLLSWGAQYGRRISQREWMNFLLQDPELLSYIDFLAVHGYDSHFVCEPVDHPPTITNGWNTSVPGIDLAFADFKSYIDNFASLKSSATSKPTLMTEVCYAIEFNNYPSNTSLCPKLPRTDFLDAMQWGRMLFGDLAAGATGWIYWNLLLDTEGGPYLLSPVHNDPANNFQQPVVVVDPANDSYTLSGVYWAMAHFSKWIRPGMSKIENFLQDSSSSCTPPNVHAIAFVGDIASSVINHNKNNSNNNNNSSSNSSNNKNTASPFLRRFVVQFMNDRVEPFTVSLSLFAGQYQAQNFTLPPVSFVTVEFFANATLENITINGNNTNNKNNNGNSEKDDDLSSGWQGPVVGTICALVFVAAVSITFMKKQRASQQQQQQQQGPASNREGDYKQMA